MSGTRPSHLARELIRRGHRVTVLTVDWSSPAAPRTAPLPGDPEVIAIDPRAWYPGFDPDKLSIEPPLPASPWRRRVIALRRTLGDGPFESWAKAGQRALLAHHRARPLDVVWSIHGDDSSHAIAHQFSRRTRVPWVADFKDAWDLFHTGPVRLVQWLATARRLRTASALTETCAAQGVSDAARFGLPYHLLWSGYDADLMERADPVRTSLGFTLIYVGNIGPQHDVAAIGRLFDAWQRLRSRPVEVELHAYSNDATRLREQLQARGHERFLTVHGFVPREKAYGIMKGAGALLLLPQTHYAPSGGSIGVKEFEYLASGTPVLSLGRLLPELDEVTRGCPQLFEAGSAMEGAAFLRDEAAVFREGEPSPRRAGVNLPSVKKQAWPEKAADLERILERVVSRYSRTS